MIYIFNFIRGRSIQQKNIHEKERERKNNQKTNISKKTTYCNKVHINYVKCIIVYTHITLELYRLD